jgi:hypothetical protein
MKKRSLLAESTEDHRIAILLTTLIAGAIGAGYMHVYWDSPSELTIPLHMNPAQSRVVSWAPRWVPVTVMAVLAMALWRLFVARGRGISTKGAVITLFVVFILHHGVAFVCLDYGAALQYMPPPPLWQMLAMFPLQLLGGLFTAGVMFMISGPIEWIVALVLACAVGIPVAEFGKLIWSEDS